MRAVVVGGGIAGPAVALALQKVGIEPSVVEARPADARAAGSWFTISPNGLAALAEVDALQRVRALGVPTRRNVMTGATGRTLGTLSLGAPLDDGTPALSFHRPRLASALLDEVAERGIRVYEGTRVEAVSESGDVVVVDLADGRRLTADVVIGADGIHSAVRACIDPTGPAGRYVGLTNFGGITRNTPLSAALAAESWTFVFGRRAFFGALPTPAGDVVWFANVPREPISPAERAATTLGDWRSQLVELADADDGPVAALIRDGELELAGDNTFDLPTVPIWHRGRIGLIGDAVHAPAPSSGQGASMALEDAVVMASSLGRADTVQEGLRAFEHLRRQRVEKIVAMGARASSTKTPRGLRRVLNDTAMRLVFRYVVTERSQEWVFAHRVRIETPAGTGDRDAGGR
ncbi:FAD-dependent monooxygenase [Gordonia sp. OPL2]|uniref:FAD-dependent monooxygenase n=1 Tax=Gordonia sp. OPL2 TaxID=2486274 RepID=UPI001654D8A1|nr:FAD-dependent monooxygenase [Gordonia sp. OPL2]ROZ87340.1 FAD-dependent monooxygenase [Gordonia sp. OPL2]